MLTNRLGLPQAIVTAVENDPYNRGDSDISVTQLIQPPFQRSLRAANEVVEDASDRIWSLMGQIGHSIVERAYPQYLTEAMKSLEPAEVWERYGVVAERRLFMNVRGWKVSGQFDVIEDRTLMDFKFTSAWSVIGDVKNEWTTQLNFLRLLALHARIPVERLRIIAVLRDWQKSKAKFDKDYPQAQVVPVDITVWPEDFAAAQLDQRVMFHQAPNPAPCSDEERWKREDVWAVMKKGGKRAIKLHPVEHTAVQHVAELGRGHEVVKRPGEYVRCMDYCNVMHVCPQMKTEF